ncbi:PKD domain-containing protein [Bacteroidota bacterium]
MRKILVQIILFLIIPFAGISAQEHISADQTSGCDSLSVQFTLKNAYDISIYASIEWKFGDGAEEDSVLSVLHTYTDPGIYKVQCVLDGARLIEYDTLITVSITPYANFSFKDTSVNELEYRYYFETQYFSSLEGVDINYKWKFPDGSEVYDSVAEYLFPKEDIYNIFLQISDEVGCSDSITKKVPVSKELVVPNVFSPDGNHMNDYFEVSTPGDYSYYFKVFTPDGLLVYSSISPEIIWDGRTFGGREVPEGVYYYVIESEETPVETSIVGFVYIFRDE